MHPVFLIIAAASCWNENWHLLSRREGRGLQRAAHTVLCALPHCRWESLPRMPLKHTALVQYIMVAHINFFMGTGQYLTGNTTPWVSWNVTRIDNSNTADDSQVQWVELNIPALRKLLARLTLQRGQRRIYDNKNQNPQWNPAYQNDWIKQEARKSLTKKKKKGV